MKKIKLEYTHNGSVANITLDDGKGNVLDSVMMNELHELFHEFRDRKFIKLIIFSGAGKHFSFGASVEEHKKENAAGMLRSFHNLFYELIGLSIPTLAKISGQCLGGGMELALMCNFMFADETAKFGQPEIVLGVFAPPSSLLLPLKIGYALAEELLITGNTISAEEAFNLGLLNEVFLNKDEMELSVNNWIEKNILPKSASSLRYAVKASRMRINDILNSYLPKLEKLFINELMETEDANEGIASFLEKRQPVWKNS